MAEQCQLCEGDLIEQKYGPLECDECGARHPDEDDGERYDIKLRDVYVHIEMVGEDYDDQREPEFDTEKAVILQWGGEDIKIQGRGDIWRAEHTLETRGHDEINIFGAGIHGEIHREMTFHAKRVTLEDYRDDDYPQELEYYVNCYDHI